MQVSNHFGQPLAALLAQIEKKVTKEQFYTWFAPLKLRRMDAGGILFEVPNAFHKSHLQTNCAELIRDTARAVFGVTGPVGFVVAAQDAGGFDRSPALEEPPSLERQLNRHYVFENFIVGPNNRLAHAASVAVAESPGKAYNPLFIHSAVGLGKTHLLQAICFSLLARSPRPAILYISCETFINNFISAVQSSTVNSFREMYTTVDVLAIDDIHFLANKERTQEQFFHTFNTLYNEGRQIILSSDSDPREIPALEERLVSRFKWGLVAKIDSPSYETRVAIIRSKAKLRGLALPDDVIEYVARNITTNIREIEGAIVRLAGYASLARSRITLDFAKEILKDAVSRRTAIRIEDIVREVADMFSIKVSALHSRKRTKSIAFPRQLCMYLARELASLSYDEIGAYIGGRDHTTVMYAVEKIRDLLAKDRDLRNRVDKIKERLFKIS